MSPELNTVIGREQADECDGEELLESHAPAGDGWAPEKHTLPRKYGVVKKTN